MAKLEFFSDSRTALNKETKNHPALAPLLASYDSDDFAGRLGEIAAFCGIIVDGNYTESELDKLCEILFFKLREARMIYIQ